VQITFTLWPQSTDGVSSQCVVEPEKPAWISADGVLLDSLTASGVERAILVRPIQPEGGLIGVAIVPRSGMIAINGAPKPAGAHGLHHGDSLVVAGRQYYVSVPLIATESLYDPAVHPPEAHCFITKARLAPNDPVTVCPGTTEKPCGYLYKRDAWNQVMSRPGTKCAHCGFHPALPQWKPPAGKDRPTRARLERLLAVMRTA